MLIELIMGDPSHDGHGMTKSVVVNVENTDSVQDVKQAFEIGAVKIGFNITKSCCEYEDNEVSVANLRKLNGFDLSNVDGYDESLQDDESIGLYWEDYADIWIFTARIGNPSLVIRKIKPLSRIDIDGYGLFNP